MSHVGRLHVGRWQRASLLLSPPPPQLSPSPLGQRPSPPGAPPACRRPAAASSRRIGVPTLGGCSETLCPLSVSLLSHCQSAPTPAPPSPTPFTAEPPASLGSRRNRLQNARARSPLPPRAARRPPPRPAPVAQTRALRARLSRPFRCSSQDGGRRVASRRCSPGPCQSISLPSTAAGSEAAGGAAPHQPAHQARRRYDLRGPKRPPAPPVAGVGVEGEAAGTRCSGSLGSP